MKSNSLNRQAGYVLAGLGLAVLLLTGVVYMRILIDAISQTNKSLQETGRQAEAYFSRITPQ